MTSKTENAGTGNGANASEAGHTPDAEGAEGASLPPSNSAAAGAQSCSDLVLSLDDMSSDEEKRKVIHELALRIMPEAVDPSIWGHWLSGGPPPYSPNALVSPTPAGVAMGRARFRQSRALMSAGATLEKAEKRHRQLVSEAQKAEKDLALAKEEFALVKAKDSAIVEYLVTKHIAEVLSPVFAMGPAWVVVRAVSAHVDQSVLERDMVLIKKPAEREAFIERRRNERRASSDDILESLDYWAGDPDYEDDIHEALHKIAMRYKGLERPFGKQRNASALRKSVAEEAKVSAHEVLEELRKVKP